MIFISCPAVYIESQRCKTLVDKLFVAALFGNLTPLAIRQQSSIPLDYWHKPALNDSCFSAAKENEGNKSNWWKISHVLWISNRRQDSALDWLGCASTWLSSARVLTQTCTLAVESKLICQALTKEGLLNVSHHAAFLKEPQKKIYRLIPRLTQNNQIN